MRSFSLLALLAIASVSFAQVERGEPLARKPSFGAQLAALTPEEAKNGAGVKIVRVMPGTSAEALKFQANDVLVQIDGKPVEAPAGITAALRGKATGDVMTWRVLRDGKPVDLKGPLKEKPRQKEAGLTVVYDQVVSQGKRIRVIATHPEGKGPFPTIFMIGGIGAYSLDGDYAGTPYGNVLGQFAKKYAIVRIDKPGQGDSEGPIYTDLLFDVELDAYRQALKLTKTYDFVSKDKIAIFGHSMGGAFGPLIAAEQPIAGLAICGTMGKTWFEYMLENTRRQSLLGGNTPDRVDTLMRDLAPVFHYMFNDGLSAAEIKSKYPSLAAQVDSVIPDGKTYSGVGLPFFQQLAKKNLIEAYAKSNTHVAAIYCENDFLTSEADHTLIVDAVNRVQPGKAEYIRLPESDHGFMKTSSQLDSLQNWGRGGRAFNPNIVEALSKWLEKTIG
jgi:pimeloyl-ACP methyl ester carboxylesterase